MLLNPLTPPSGAATCTSQVDASYLDRFRKRMAATAAAKVEKRKVSIIEDEKTMNDLEAGLAHAPLYVKNRQVCAGWCTCCCTSRVCRLVYMLLYVKAVQAGVRAAVCQA